jgi:type II secretory pathway pseudopilin PulG
MTAPIVVHAPPVIVQGAPVVIHTDPVVVHTNSALIGLVGILAGVLIGGGVRMFIEWRNRKREAQGAARMLYMELQGAQQAIEDLQARKDWDKLVTDWTSYGRAWEKYAEPLSRVVKDTKQFLGISSAFSTLVSLANARAKFQGMVGPQTMPPDRLLERYRAGVQAAKRPILKQAFTRRERKSDDYKTIIEAELAPK